MSVCGAHGCQGRVVQTEDGRRCQRCGTYAERPKTKPTHFEYPGERQPETREPTYRYPPQLRRESGADLVERMVRGKHPKELSAAADILAWWRDREARKAAKRAEILSSRRTT